jgi:exodeoxyribonuclease VII small subunit
MKKSEDNAASPELRFEDAYRELEEIVDQLESGDLALDESMALFERGRGLIALCETQLSNAELRVTQLLTDASGNVRAEPLT